MIERTAPPRKLSAATTLFLACRLLLKIDDQGPAGATYGLLVAALRAHIKRCVAFVAKQMRHHALVRRDDRAEILFLKIRPLVVVNGRVCLPLLNGRLLRGSCKLLLTSIQCVKDFRLCPRLAMSSSWRSLAATTSAPADQVAGFKRCCLKSGRHDGSRRNHFFQAEAMTEVGSVGADQPPQPTPRTRLYRGLRGRVSSTIRELLRHQYPCTAPPISVSYCDVPCILPARQMK